MQNLRPTPAAPATGPEFTAHPAGPAPSAPGGRLPGAARHATLALLVAALVACGGHSAREAAAPKPAADDADAALTAVRAAPPPAEPEARERKIADAATGQVAAVAPQRAYMARSLAASPSAPTEVDRENYAHIEESGIRVALTEPVSTFSIDVDTGAYSNVRRMLNEGRLPPEDAVRVEELINYFGYDYPLRPAAGAPFSVQTEVAPTPWNPDTLLLHIGIQTAALQPQERLPANLVFLLDVSGSMHSADKLPLLKRAFRTLVDSLDGRDTVAMVVYAGASGVVLEPTPGDDRAAIDAALAGLQAGGSTNGASGIRLAYDVARAAYIDGGINRVLLATDGDFNVGTVSFEALLDLAERERASGIALTTLGFGSGNYNDRLMEQLADAGNGNHAYIDSDREARKVLGEQLGATLQTVASDVKIQVEFNPQHVAEYRLIGYENRALERADFNNDRVDAGEIGAGHSVTAVYELTPVGSPATLVDTLRYAPRDSAAPAASGELAFLRLRYKAPGGDTSRLLEFPVQRSDLRAPRATSDDFRFAAAVAAFGQQLRGGRYIGDYALDETAALAGGAVGRDRHGYRREFVSLVHTAMELGANASGAGMPLQVTDRGAAR